ncbi:MAG: DUF5723 family protein [Prevotellaceae bacterium]|jgi:hypothetical protein|nr:DUF5723 family protein [Prevotellaceae bacterium]
MKKILLLALLFCNYTLLAQPNMTLYQMHDITQSNILNPAVPISCGWVVGFPGLGSISVGASTPVSYNDLGPGNDTLDVNNVLSKIRNKNMLTTSAAVNLITIGYRSERTFYQFTVNERFSQVSSAPKDPVEMLLKGNAMYVGKTIKASPSVNAIYYREYAFNIARELNPTLWVGARAKLLFGRMSLKMARNIAEFYTDPGTYDLSLTTDLLMKTSIPGEVIIDPYTGKISDFEVNIKAGDLSFNTSNIGAGIDLGLVKDFENGMQLSTSLLNLGFINWNKNLHTFSQKGTLKFTGPFSRTNELDALVDTVKSFLHLDYTEESYAQLLSPMLMAGINYPVNDFLRLGITGMAEFQSGALPWAITAIGFTQGLPIVDLGLSYTVTPSSFFNLGVGIGAHLGPVDIHFLADNIMAVFKPFDAKYATVQLGISFRFGCGDGGEGRRDTPKEIPCPAYNQYRK